MEMEIIDLFPWLGLWFKATDVYSKLGEAVEDKAALFLGCVVVLPFLLPALLKALDRMILPFSFDLSNMTTDEYVKERMKPSTEQHICFNCLNYNMREGKCAFSGRKIKNPNNQTCDYGFTNRY